MSEPVSNAFSQPGAHGPGSVPARPFRQTGHLVRFEVSRPDLRGQVMRRREFIGLLGGAAAWPLAAHAQQKAGPTIGLLGCTSADESTRVLDALRAGLKDSGFVENQNLRIEYRWAHGRHGRLSALARDLVNHQAVAIVT